jgi:hypothetical protein
MGNTHSKQLKRTFSKSSRHTIAIGETARVGDIYPIKASKTRTSSIAEEEEETENEEEERNKAIPKNALAIEQLLQQQLQLREDQQQPQYPNAILTKTASLPPSPTGSYPLSSIKMQAETLIIKGRRYQNYNTKYILPADDQEQDRLVQCVSPLFN